MSLPAGIANVFAPLVVGRRLGGLEDLAAILAPYRGNPFAKAGVELCWWALLATRRGVPLRRLFGGRDDPVPAGEAVGRLASVEAVLGAVQEAVERGFPRVKLKICRGWDLGVVRAVRGAFPDLRLQVDANGGYSLADLPLLRALDEFGLELIEQPLHYRDLAEHAVLQQQLQTAVCLDESVCSLADAERALRLGACRVMNLKIGRVGGLGPALAIAERCRNSGCGVWVGSMLETGIGSSCNVELASALDGAYAHDLPTHGRFLRRDVVDPGVELAAAGMVRPGDGVYPGRAILADRIHSLTVSRHSVRGR